MLKVRGFALLSMALPSLFLGVNVKAQQKISEPVRKAMEQASADDMKATITYLADDKLKGRMPGTEGFQMAADYTIAQLKAYGVKPAGENGTWQQAVKLRKALADRNAKTEITLEGKPLENAHQHIAITGNPQEQDVDVNSGLVFAGYGVSEPKLGYDDYAGINVKGKIVVILRGAPSTFESSVVAHVQNATTILKVASEHGAVGVIIGTADSAARFMAGSRPAQYSVLDKAGKVTVSRSFYSDKVKLFANMDYKLFSLLMKQNGKTAAEVAQNIKSGKTSSFVINGSLHTTYHTLWQDINSFNLVGKIEGTDPKLKNEYVVHSAHLDHVGIGPAVQGDSIYNGAHDNASGVASLLQIAKIYHNMPQKPKRSILVVMVTGEEMGDLGSGYFAKYPTVPVKQMVADVNTDMPTIIAPLLSITALGAEHSSLAKQVDEAAADLGLSVEPDPEPDQNRFVRSDQYSFVVQGIPALHVKYGSKTPDGKNNLNDLVKVWREKYYHKPQDDINGIFDFNAGRKYAQLNFLIGYLVAQDVQRPIWNKGDIFEKR